MPNDKGDEAYLWDMLASARDVSAAVAGVEFDHYLSTRTLQMAVERGIEIIGEAARFVSDSYRAAHSEIPWKIIVGQRHVLAHHYASIKQDRLWRAATIHVPELIQLLEPLVPPSE